LLLLLKENLINLSPHHSNLYRTSCAVRSAISATAGLLLLRSGGIFTDHYCKYDAVQCCCVSALVESVSRPHPRKEII